MTAITKTWLLPALIAGGLSLASGWFTNDRDLSNRVTALEVHRLNADQKLDHIQTQVDKLVEWALGKK